jgi:hypothetical protein
LYPQELALIGVAPSYDFVILSFYLNSKAIIHRDTF